MVTLGRLEDPEEIAEVRDIIRRHVEYTGSTRGASILDRWDEMCPRFVKVMPVDYQRMLAAVARAEASGLCGDDAVMAAFEDNIHDLARVGGN
jgi:glutamate synthase (ferredoxin)